MVKLVGILNVTPDSFSDGGQFLQSDVAIAHAARLFDEGAAMIDVGAESTRPNAVPLSDAEEWERLEPVLRALIAMYPGKISVDSYHPQTIQRIFNEIGPVIVNDVTGFNSPGMVEVASVLKPMVIVSHLPGADIQVAHKLVPVSSVEQVRDDLLAKARSLHDKGLTRGQIVLDPGIGFGKTMEVNERLLRFAEQVPGYDVMVGYSRKRFLGENRMELATNLAAGKIAVAHGATYLRVHDVAGHASLLV